MFESMVLLGSCGKELMSNGYQHCLKYPLTPCGCCNVDRALVGHAVVVKVAHWVVRRCVPTWRVAALLCSEAGFIFSRANWKRPVQGRALF